MLKNRLIACLVVKAGIVVQSIGFNRYLPVGKPEIAAEYLNSWGVDEIILVDIDASLEGRGPNFEMIERVSKKCFVPLTIGGGINSVEIMKQVVRCGADKIAINSAAANNPELIRAGANVLGDQCIVVSVDARRKKNHGGCDDEYEVVINNGKESIGIDPVTFSLKCEELGAGEILLNSVDCDGSKKGFDLDLIRSVSNVLKIPLIALGGAGHPEHFAKALINGGATAVAAGNYFNFSEHSVITTKAYLKSKFDEIPVRIGTYATYEGFTFDSFGKICKRDESFLKKIRFEYHPEEII